MLRLQAEVIPLCEVKLVKKLTELLNSVEPIETTIKDAIRKAKTKLQREWSNFKEGYVLQHISYILKYETFGHYFSKSRTSSHIKTITEKYCNLRY